MSTKKLSTMALLIAISIILTRFFSVYLPILGIASVRIGFGDLPIILAGIFFGPIAGATVGVIADLVGGLFLNPLGYFPGWTLSAALTGALPIIFLRIMKIQPNNINWKNLTIALVLTFAIVGLGLNTLWVSMMYGKAFWVLLPIRIGTFPISTAITIILTTALYNVSKNVVSSNALVTTS